MAAKRRLYWVTPEVGREHDLRATILAGQSYDVRFFSTPEDLYECIQQERAGIIVVSDTGDRDVAAERLNKVIAIPEARGVRLLLSIERHHADILSQAAAMNFRDMIPIGLDDQQWLRRLEYATAGRPIPIEAPAGQITMSNISAVHVPARMVWISQQKMRFETSLAPKVGSVLSLTGEMARRVGVRSLTFCVEKIERSHLHYRFSDALVGHWSVSREARSKATQLIESLRGRSEMRTCRILLAARSTSLRSKVFGELRGPLYEINAIPKVQSLVQEPKYFSPDVVIIEDALCLGRMSAMFSEMLTQLQLNTPVIITGDSPAVSDLVRRNAAHNLIAQERLPPQLLQSPLAVYLQPKAGSYTDIDGVPIATQDELSFLEVVTPARLSCIHPTLVQVDLPHRLRNFALCRLSSPIVGKILSRDVWIKLTECFHNDQASDEKFSETAEAILCDLTRVDRKNMGRQLARLITAHYKRIINLEESVESFEEHSDRTPEFASLTAQAITTAQEVPVSIKKLEPVAVVARSIPRSQTRPAPSTDPSIDQIWEWLTSKKTKKVLGQIAWSAVGIALIGALIWALMQRDENEAAQSGKWFHDQIYKFAPHKFED